MPRRVSEISCFSNFDIACAFALRSLGYNDSKTENLMVDGRDFARYVEAYCRRPMVRFSMTIVPRTVAPRRLT